MFYDPHSILDLLDNLGKSAEKTKNMYTWTESYALSHTEHAVENGTEIYVDVPGCKKENISLTLDENKLYVTATRTRGRSETLEHTYNVNDIEVEEITSELVDGVLCIFLPKKKSKSRKKIEVKTK